MTDKTISIYWFFILFLITFAIAFVVYSLYGKPLDIREMEGIFLAEKVADCVSQGGKIPANILTTEGFLINDENFLEKCDLNFKVEKFKGWNNDQFFVSLDFSTLGKESYSISSGNENLKNKESNLNFIDTINKEKFPFCVERTIYSNGEDGEYYSIKIFTCIRKTEKNV